ncbi:MAG: sulfatase-like hydrolase/transferase [Bacteroidota bacterium]
MSWQTVAYEVITYGLLSYSVFLLSGYIFIGLYSIGEVKRYRKKNSFTNYRLLAASTHTPGISILAPAYNEGANIIENVRSLLSIHYNNMEVIIINDGSKDDSMQKLIKVYDLYKADFFVNEQIATKKVKAVYKSRNFIYSKLIVVDKENGGKADALNVGINIAGNDYVVCIDVDCILEQDALLKLVKPFLESPSKRVIATGGVVRIANGCEIANGRLIKVNLPDQFLPRVQTLEYIRAFLLGRMAWARLNGLMLISGAFGAFDKEIVIKCGGYDHNTVGEDMELIVRMRRYMEERDLPYKVAFIPDPLCWTEAPASFKILGRQRNRWTRGTIETLKFHKIMFFNPRYGVMGLFSYPYWFFFEFLAPLVEFGGFLFFMFSLLTGTMDWAFFFSLLLLIYTFGVLYSVFAILMEVLSYNQYNTRKDILKLLLTAVLEPLVFHPFVVWSAVKGNIDFLRKKNSWGEMTRAGFSAPKGKPGMAADNIPEEIYAPEEQPDSPEEILSEQVLLPEEQPELVAEHSLVTSPVREQEAEIVQDTHPSNGSFFGFTVSVRSYIAVMAVALLLLVVFRLAEVSIIKSTKDLSLPLLTIAGWGLWADFTFWLKALLPLYLIYFGIGLASKRSADIILKGVIVLFFIIHAGLSFYFNTSLALAGADVYGYSKSDIVQTVGASGDLSVLNIGLIILLIGIIILALKYVSKSLRPTAYFSGAVLAISFLYLLFGSPAIFQPPGFSSNIENDLVVNKSDYFYNATYTYVFPQSAETDIYAESYVGNFGGRGSAVQFEYLDETNYPFLHKEAAADVLTPFFAPKENSPNIVFILMEGLGRAYSNEDAYLGSFTPFLDSLADKSLYWENFLSQQGRTFAVLPSLLGSLPFAKNGYLELGDAMPEQLSLLNLLQANGYQTSFHYGGDGDFDNMNTYLKKNGVNKILDQKTFPASYIKLPPVNGFTWGFNDKELFRHYFATIAADEVKPKLDVVLTVSTHNPFIINESSKYLKLFEDRLSALNFNNTEKAAYRNYQNQYASILYADDAVRGFINEYSKRPDFANTIFIITGDHRIPEIPMRTKIDRYHVPLIIYSPLLKRTARISSVSTHFDIAPSILAYLKVNHKMELPEQSSWMGQGLDTTRNFQNIHSVPFIQNKSDIVDFISGEYHLNGNVLFKLSSDMNEVVSSDARMKAQLTNAFNQFKRRNSMIISGKKIIPDSIFQKYTRR